MILKTSELFECVDVDSHHSHKHTSNIFRLHNNRLIFVIHPGRSGAGYLASLLDTCDEKTRSFHIVIHCVCVRALC
jgi:hypothetical protein